MIATWTEYLYTMTMPSSLKPGTEEAEVATQVSAAVEEKLKQDGFSLDDILVSVSIVGGIVIVAVSILTAATIGPFVAVGGIIAGLAVSLGAIITKWKATDFKQVQLVADTQVEEDEYIKWVIWAKSQGFLTAEEADKLIAERQAAGDVIEQQASESTGDKLLGEGEGTLKGLLTGGAGGLILGAIAAYALTRE